MVNEWEVVIRLVARVKADSPKKAIDAAWGKIQTELEPVGDAEVTISDLDCTAAPIVADKG